MLVGILTGSLAALWLYLLTVGILRDVWGVAPHPSAGGMYWVCLLLPFAAGVAAAATTLVWRRARPTAWAFLTTFVVLGIGMAAFQNFLDTFADHM